MSTIDVPYTLLGGLAASGLIPRHSRASSQSVSGIDEIPHEPHPDDLRTFEPSDVSHKYSEKERQIMNLFESTEYYEPVTKLLKTHLDANPVGSSLMKWLAFGVIGVLVALVVFVLKNTVDFIFDLRETAVDSMIQNDHYGLAWLFSLAFGCGLVIISAALPVFVEPSAAGSGIPEVIGYLNGVRVKHLFNLRTALVKFLSCIACVSSNLPVGPEGPLIHLGAAVGSGLAQGRSKFLDFTSSAFRSFRNPQDKRDFITCGVAAGVGAVFGAPLGGLLFAMEEVSSFWPSWLTWRIFFGTMICAFVGNILSAFSGWQCLATIGEWTENSTSLLRISGTLEMSAIDVLPVIILGCICGILGSIFNIINVKVTRWRRDTINPSRLYRLLEPAILMIIYHTIVFWLCFAIPCEDVADIADQSVFERPPRQFNCPHGQFNPFASLALEPGHTAAENLVIRGSTGYFKYLSVGLFLILYFIFAAIVSGTAICGGLFIPTLVIGAASGRLFGLVLEDIFTLSATSALDPGVFALFGASAFFAGSARLTISLTVIMIEMSNDTRLLVPIMLAILVAKAVGDLLTHSLYHALLEVKCVPFLEPTLNIPKADMYSIRDVMTMQVATLSMRMTVRELLKQLEAHPDHNAFPVVIKQRRPGPINIGGHSRSDSLMSISSRTEIPLSAVREASDPLSPSPLDFSFDTPERLSPALSSHALSASLALPAAASPAPSKAPVASSSSPVGHFKGLILRSQLEILLRYADDAERRSLQLKPVRLGSRSRVFYLLPTPPTQSDWVAYEEKLYGTKKSKLKPLSQCITAGLDLVLDLSPFINTSAVCVPQDFSLQLSYTLFRSLGLRHLTIVDEEHLVVGIITRKDLIGQRIEERIGAQYQSQQEPQEPQAAASSASGSSASASAAFFGSSSSGSVSSPAFPPSPLLSVVAESSPMSIHAAVKPPREELTIGSMS